MPPTAAELIQSIENANQTSHRALDLLEKTQAENAKLRDENVSLRADRVERRYEGPDPTEPGSIDAAQAAFEQRQRNRFQDVRPRENDTPDAPAPSGGASIGDAQAAFEARQRARSSGKRP